MAPEDYEILLWILGDRVAQFNFMAMSMVIAWSMLALSYEICQRLWQHLQFRLDDGFWNDTLLLDGPDDRPRRDSTITNLNLYERLTKQSGFIA
ncbi:MAG: hypothetical protein OEY67_05640 [Gammaproteobacteria bacterium]|nr:hypothetical protein [Gammaproteobacteria bacterium]